MDQQQKRDYYGKIVRDINDKLQQGHRKKIMPLLVMLTDLDLVKNMNVGESVTLKPIKIGMEYPQAKEQSYGMVYTITVKREEYPHEEEISGDFE